MKSSSFFNISSLVPEIENMNDEYENYMCIYIIYMHAISDYEVLILQPASQFIQKHM